MPNAELALRSRRVATPGGVRPATVVVEDGTVRAVGGYDDAPAGVVELGEAALLPGLVDLHVHVNEPGRTHWEGFATATRAAAAGGVTTLLDMPLNSVPPTTTPAALEAKRAAARGAVHVDVGFWGGAVPGNLDALAPLHEAGVVGFKAFLCDSGVDEFGHLSPGELDAALAELGRLGALVAVHAEDPEVLAAAARDAAVSDLRAYAAWLARRPAQAELDAVARLLDLAARRRCRVHVLHVSAAGVADLLDRARRAGVDCSGETCPHYLALAAEDVPDGAHAFKCAPPIREAANRERLWRALGDGLIDAVASDHSPCPPQRKRGDFLTAWGGIASLQLALPVVWTAARARGFGLDDLARWMAAAPARIARLTRKGVIAPGADADLVVFEPETRWVVDANALEHRHPVTPYAGAALTGRVRATYLRGRCVWDRGTIVGEPGGRLLGRGEA